MEPKVINILSEDNSICNSSEAIKKKIQISFIFECINLVENLSKINNNKKSIPNHNFNSKINKSKFEKFISKILLFVEYSDKSKNLFISKLL
jgi:hypothetical protein